MSENEDDGILSIAEGIVEEASLRVASAMQANMVSKPIFMAVQAERDRLRTALGELADAAKDVYKLLHLDALQTRFDELAEVCEQLRSFIGQWPSPGQARILDAAIAARRAKQPAGEKSGT